MEAEQKKKLVFLKQSPERIDGYGDRRAGGDGLPLPTEAMETDRAARGERFSPEVLGFMQIAVDQLDFEFDSYGLQLRGSLKNVSVNLFKRRWIRYFFINLVCGCLVVNLLATDVTSCKLNDNPKKATRHAEMEALDVLQEQWQMTGFSATEVVEKFSACSLYVTCEPCI